MIQYPAKDAICWRSCQRVVQEWHDVRVDLADDEMVHVEQLRKLVHREIIVNRSVDPVVAGGVPLNLVSVLVLGHKWRRVVNEWGGG